MNQKEQALEYYDKLLEELNSLGLNPETSELHKFITNIIKRARELTKALPSHLAEMIR